MELTMLKSKIHRAVVTEANADYVGSITVDKALMDAAGIFEYEQVHVVDVDNGSRLVTYAIAGREGAGGICLNGAAARLMNVGDKVIIMAYCRVSPREAERHTPAVVFVDGKNQIKA
ncbi:MAG: aspartate 1-decarboxylase [Clostridiales bacterium]|nr:aspartate 1-decarboxylase [Clostridiales bacterium]